MLRKLLRNAGLALILLPEPFTTPFGLALLGVSYLFTRFSRVYTPYCLRGLKVYLKETRPLAANIIRHKLKQSLTESEWHYQPPEDIPCGIDSDRLMLRFGKDMTLVFVDPETPMGHSIRQRWSGYVLPGIPGCEEKTVVHTMDSSRLLRHYEKTMPTRATAPQKTVVHTFNPAKVSLALGRA